MTKKELEEKRDSDPYLQDRRKVHEYEKRILLREVDFRCPLCKKDLLSSTQEKPVANFEIAHIYPNKPTIEQYETLLDVERLGDTCESIKNKIALCLDCHNKQDFRTSIRDYQKLLNIKKQLLNLTELREDIEDLSLDDELIEVINKITTLSEEQWNELRYSPIPIANKIEKNNLLLKTKIEGYVNKYFTYIRDCFSDLDGKNGFQLEVVSAQIKCCYMKLKKESNQTVVFDSIIDWVMKEINAKNRYACEAIVSFFVQNCEVFDEISE